MITVLTARQTIATLRNSLGKCMFTSNIKERGIEDRHTIKYFFAIIRCVPFFLPVDPFVLEKHSDEISEINGGYGARNPEECLDLARDSFDEFGASLFGLLSVGVTTVPICGDPAVSNVIAHLEGWVSPNLGRSGAVGNDSRRLPVKKLGSCNNCTTRQEKVKGYTPSPKVY